MYKSPINPTTFYYTAIIVGYVERNDRLYLIVSTGCSNLNMYVSFDLGDLQYLQMGVEIRVTCDTNSNSHVCAGWKGQEDLASIADRETTMNTGE